MVQSIVDARKMDFEQIRVLARCYKNQGLNRIYLHWSAGPYNTIAPDYHFSIDGNGFVYNMNPLDKKLAATWRRNTGSINIALMCCADAVCYSEDSVDFGKYPPTIYQVQAMAKLVCILCEELDLDIDMDAVLKSSNLILQVFSSIKKSMVVDIRGHSSDSLKIAPIVFP